MWVFLLLLFGIQSQPSAATLYSETFQTDEQDSTPHDINLAFNITLAFDCDHSPGILC